MNFTSRSDDLSRLYSLPKSNFKRLAHQSCHPERSEGSRGGILRYAQNDITGWSRRTMYQCHAFWFSDQSRYSNTYTKPIAASSMSMSLIPTNGAITPPTP